MFLAAYKDSIQSISVLFEGSRVDNDVVQVDHLYISMENVAGALVKPKGIRLYSYRPDGVINAVLCRSAGSIAT